jgi:hypothetical protein
MHSCKLYQFVNNELKTRNINDGTLDDNLRKSAFTTPAYFGGTFPFYLNVEDWPRSPEKIGRELVYTAKLESPSTLIIDKDLNISLRNAASRTSVETLTLIAQETICFIKYFNRFLTNIKASGSFSLAVVLEYFTGIPLNWIGFKEIDRIGLGGSNNSSEELPRLSNWNFLSEDNIATTSPIPFQLPIPEDSIFESYGDCIADIMVNIAFNVEGERFYARKGRVKDRIRLDLNHTKKVIKKFISDET